MTDEQYVEITIDGQRVRAFKGRNLLEVIREMGIDIPSACYRSDGTDGQRKIRCKLCLVELDGRVNPVTACTETVKGRMVVSTNTPRLKEARRTNLRDLFGKHYDPKNCAACIWDGGCSLHSLAEQFGIL